MSVSSIPVIILPLPEIARILGVPESLLCEFVTRRLIHYLNGPADWGVAADHWLNDPRRAKLSLEVAAFCLAIYRDCKHGKGRMDEYRRRYEACGWDSEPEAQEIALKVLKKFVARSR